MVVVVVVVVVVAAKRNIKCLKYIVIIIEYFAIKLYLAMYPTHWWY